MKSIILSVSPQEAVNVLNGKASMLLRKRIPKGFKGWCYLWVRKGKPYLYKDAHKPMHSLDKTSPLNYRWYLNSKLFNIDLQNGKVIARFWWDESEEIMLERKEIYLYEDDYEYQTVKLDATQLMGESCLNNQELENYLGDLIGYKAYAIRIKNLEIFDKPKMLGEFYNIAELRKANHIYYKDISIVSEVEKLDKLLDAVLDIEYEAQSSYCRVTNAPKNYIYVCLAGDNGE